MQLHLGAYRVVYGVRSEHVEQRLLPVYKVSTRKSVHSAVLEPMQPLLTTQKPPYRLKKKPTLLYSKSLTDSIT